MYHWNTHSVQDIFIFTALRVGCSETGAMEVELPDDPFDVTRIDVSKTPTLVTVNKVRHTSNEIRIFKPTHFPRSTAPLIATKSIRLYPR